MKVSILIPFFNAADFLSATIESALLQSYSDKEIILVDDGSSDESLAIAKSFIPRGVKVFSQPNYGACRARNRAFTECSGDYIQFLDADDLLSADKITNQMRIASERDIVLSSRFVRFYNENRLPEIHEERKFLERDWGDPVEWLTHEWQGKGMGHTAIWLTPRNLIKRAGLWDERLSINQDGEYFCRVLLQAKAIRFCNESTVYYRSGNNQSVSQRMSNRRAADLLLSYRLYQQHVLGKEDSERVRRALACKYLTFIYAYYDSHPDLVSEAKAHLHGLRVPNLPEAGGKHFKMLAKAIGFENALRARSVIRKILN